MALGAHEILESNAVLGRSLRRPIPRTLTTLLARPAFTFFYAITLFLYISDPIRSLRAFTKPPNPMCKNLQERLDTQWGAVKERRQTGRDVV